MLKITEFRKKMYRNKGDVPQRETFRKLFLKIWKFQKNVQVLKKLRNFENVFKFLVLQNSCVNFQIYLRKKTSGNIFGKRRKK